MTTPMARFTGRGALVTGAGGSIGRAAARRLASEGATLALFDIQTDELDLTRAQCLADGAPAAHGFEVDQTDEDRVADGVTQAAEALGGIDVLFANAGFGQFATFLATSSRAWQRHVDINFTGTFHVCQQVARHMVERREGGAIVINASSGAVRHADQLSAYCATKAGLRMLAIGMASELGIHGIRVNAVMPGAIESNMTAPMLVEDDHRQEILANTPLGRIGEPDDVAGLVAFLASDDAGYVTGESVLLDGGQTIHGHPRWFRQDYRDRNDERWTIRP